MRDYNPEQRILKFCRRVQAAVMPEADGVIDRRMNYAQMRDAVYKVLGCEPIIIDAKLLELCLDKRSKWFGKATVQELHKMAQDIHYAIHPAPDARSRKICEEESQFELNFEWSVKGEEKVAQLMEAAE